MKKNIKRKMLPKKDAPNGLYLYCSKHRRWYKNDNVVKCKCDLKYKAKVHVPGTKRKSRIKTFEAENFETALQIFAEFKKTLKMNNFQDIKIEVKKQKPIYFLDCVSEFIDFKNDIGVDYQERKNLPRGNIRYAERSLEYFTFALIENDIKPDILKFTEINSKIVGFVTEYLKETKKLKNKSYNNILQNLKSFMKYIVDKHYPNFDNPFKSIKKRKVFTNPKSIKILNFNKMVKLISEENGYGYSSKGKKLNFYRPWIANAFFLGLFTGGRREEVVKMKWSDIRYNEEDQISFIEVKDLKINRKLKDSIDEENFVVKRVEMSPEFQDLLMAMGYEEHKDSDQYILAPDEKMKRTTMMEFVSHAFTHFYSLLDLEDGLTFKHLRKTFVTKNYIQAEQELKNKHKEFHERSGHSSKSVALKHYVDMSAVLESKRKRNFGSESD